MPASCGSGRKRRSRRNGSAGRTNDHYYYEDSIVYQPWTTVQQLSDVDWIMLNMLYSPLTYPGMQKQELHETFMDESSR